MHRYYDEASSLLGGAETPPIETFAKKLGDLILRLRDLVCGNAANGIAPADFRCYLVAHSMGGLVSRAFLQNPDLGSDEARACVDKFFTYATPHNGIEMGGINVPSWLNANSISNFSRDKMAKYLNIAALHKRTDRVDWLPEAMFPSRKVFCMVATNRGDYKAAMGLSRTFAGEGSDGLVRIDNASVWGVDATGKTANPCATAYAYRSHSGVFGIVNSEESYQNLVRFLFGDIRVDLWLDIDDVRVPQELEEDDAAGKLDALYQFEVLASARGKRWYLTRRAAEEDSVACRRHKDIRENKDPNAKRIYLSSIFLANRARVNQARPTLAYSMTLGVRTPDYEVDKRFRPDRHYEGGYLFRDAVVIELLPPSADTKGWGVTYDWQRDNVGQSSTPLPVDTEDLRDGSVELFVPFETPDVTPPRSAGIKGKLRFVVSQWNAADDVGVDAPKLRVRPAPKPQK